GGGRARGERDAARARRRVRGEPEDACDADREADGGLERLQGNPGGEPVRGGDPVGAEGDRDRGARDADVAGGERDEPGDVERRENQDGGDDGLVNADRGRDGGRAGEAAGDREADPAGETDGGRWVLAELAEGIEEVSMAAARTDGEGRGGEDEPA